jgi:hypothetical protein
VEEFHHLTSEKPAHRNSVQASEPGETVTRINSLCKSEKADETETGYELKTSSEGAHNSLLNAHN